MKKSLFLIVIAMMLVLSACTSASKKESGTDTGAKKSEKSEVNLYTSRHYDVDNELYKKFEEETGIKVNVIKDEADVLIERIKREGTATKADLLLTADVGRLYRAKEEGLLQSVSSDKLSKQIPGKLRDVDDMWVGLTKRARILVYNKDKV
ncbi:extracellular solute-binding protein, partial [Microvirga sp. 3-52]|nr:extracellular solute-binding protein [Microvirga sp. 3-52]